MQAAKLILKNDLWYRASQHLLYIIHQIQWSNIFTHRLTSMEESNKLQFMLLFENPTLHVRTSFFCSDITLSHKLVFWEQTEATLWLCFLLYLFPCGSEDDFGNLSLLLNTMQLMLSEPKQTMVNLDYAQWAKVKL